MDWQKNMKLVQKKIPCLGFRSHKTQETQSKYSIYMFIANSQSDLKIAFGPPVSETLKFVVAYQRLT